MSKINPEKKDENKNELTSKIKQFVNAEEQKRAKERENFIRDKGMLPFFNFPEGETEIELQLQIPEERETTNGIRMNFWITVDDVDYTWGVNPRSPVYPALLHHLVVAPKPLRVIRVGTQKQTRYSILEFKS